MFIYDDDQIYLQNMTKKHHDLCLRMKKNFMKSLIEIRIYYYLRVLTNSSNKKLKKIANNKVAKNM